jgi:glucan endo-1,3-alpha-glucosidase
MELAKEIGIDAFALNCASIDKYTDPQLALAYEAAEAVNFKVFISFDFAYWSNGDSPRITSIMQKYANHPGQFQYGGAALVSTFVGDSFNWTPVKSAVQHPLFAVPMIQDPAWSGTANTGIDGAFSWYAWPTDGGNSIIPGPMTTVWDDRYLKSLGNKAYMARKFHYCVSMIEMDADRCSCFSVVLDTLQHQELGLHLRGTDYYPLAANARNAARADRDHLLERYALNPNNPRKRRPLTK